MDSNVTVKKNTKHSLKVDYDGKLSFWQRLKKRLTTSNTWIKVLVNIFRFIMMLGISYVILYPFFSKIAQSFMTKEDIIDPTVSLIPRHFTTDIYKYLAIENHYFEALLNTAILSLIVALLQTLIACLVGYGLAKFKFKGNKLVMAIVVLTMIIPHQALRSAISNFFMEFDFFQIRILPRVLKVFGVDSWTSSGIIAMLTGSPVNLQGTYWPMAIISISGLAFKNGLYIYMMRQFFKGVPDELEESAYVDGSGVFRTFFQIIIPLSVPMMITIFLFSFSWQWTDEFYIGMFSLDNIHLLPDLYKNQAPSLDFSTHASWYKYRVVIENTAGLMIIAPLVIVYLFCQRYLVQGIERSGLVG